MFVDQQGLGHSYTSEIQGGAKTAGTGHNNLVTLTVDQTSQAMNIANNMPQKMNKMGNQISKDLKNILQKP